MKKAQCTKCGNMLQPYWVKDGMCNGCRNPASIVEAVTETQKSASKFYNWEKDHLLKLIQDGIKNLKEELAFEDNDMEKVGFIESDLEDLQQLYIKVENLPCNN